MNLQTVAQSQAAEKRARLRDLEADMPVIKLQTSPAALERRRVRLIQHIRSIIGAATTDNAVGMIGRLKEALDAYAEPEAQLEEYRRLRSDVEATAADSLAQARGL